MAFSSSRNYGDGPKAEINVTPLVDVMLVMLIIFMVTAPLLQQGVEVNLPKTTNAPLAGSEEQLVISVDKSGKIFLGAGNEVSIEEIGKKTAAVLSTKPESLRKVYIKADSQLQYQTIMDLMGKLYLAGITQIGLVSAPAQK